MNNEPIKNEDSLADYLDGLKKDESSSVVTEEYDRYRETQEYILQVETRKTRNMLLILAALYLLMNIIAVTQVGASISDYWLEVLLVPAILTGFGFLAIKEPLVAVILAILLVFGLWIYSIYIFGTRAIIVGWLWKGITIYLLIASVQHAKLAHKIKRELKL